MSNNRRSIPDSRRILGSKIKKRRNELDLSQQQVANRLSHTLGEPIQRSTYAHYETGYAAIDAITFKALADVLRCSTSALLEEHTCSDHAMEDPIAVYYANLPENLKPVAIAMLKAMSEQAEHDTLTD